MSSIPIKEEIAAMSNSDLISKFVKKAIAQEVDIESFLLKKEIEKRELDFLY